MSEGEATSGDESSDEERFEMMAQRHISRLRERAEDDVKKHCPDRKKRGRLRAAKMIGNLEQ